MLGEGEPTDLRTYLDGALILDLWDAIVIPAVIRCAWEPVIATYGDTA